jgi:hypothetical protein
MLSFCKFHGFGNDYIVFEATELKNISSINEFAARVCHRHTGIGGDGIAVIEKSLETRLIIRAASSTRTAAKPDLAATEHAAPSLIFTTKTSGGKNRSNSKQKAASKPTSF